MSAEHEDDKKNGPAGAAFERGIKSVLDKAPGLLAPSWSTMQTAMAGGAAGGAAAASWRWIVGPVAAAAMVGAAFWITDPVEQKPAKEGEVAEVESKGEDSEMEAFTEGPWPDEMPLNGVRPPMDSPNAEVLAEVLQSQKESLREGGVLVDPEEPSAQERGEGDPQASAVEVPSDWAELPAEKAAAFETEVTAACVGTEIGFRMAQPMTDVRVLWNFGDGQFSSESSPQHTFNAPGTYDITLSVTRISDGLIRTRTIENLVTIHPKPQAEFTWEVPSTAEDLPVIGLRDRSRDAASTTWLIDGESTQVGESVSFALDRVGEHVIQLVASSPQGCQNVASHRVEVGSRFGLGASARFSPNGDGRYDQFLPRKLLREDRPFVFRVQDMDGHVVYETTRPEPWDGQLPGSLKAQQGDQFAWTAVIQGTSGPAYYSDVLQVE